MSDQLEYFEDHDLEFNQVLASHHGKGVALELKVNYSHLGFTYTVSSFGNIKYKGSSSLEAVDMYNELDH